MRCRVRGSSHAPAVYQPGGTAGTPGRSGAAADRRLVTPDVLVAGLPQNGTFETVYDVPDVPAFVGFEFHQQVAALELAPSGAFVALVSTNALACTKGMF